MSQDGRPLMVSIPVSPYVELARWVLDRRGIAYVEEGHVPFLHLAAALLRGGGTEVPVLVTADGTKRNAREVVEWAESSSAAGVLQPDEQPPNETMLALYESFYGPFGVAVRAWAYAWMLPERQAVLHSWGSGAPGYERLAAGVAYPLLAGLMRRALDIGPQTIADQTAAIDAVFDHVADLLADGRKYLCGDRISLADLALAALAGPAIVPEGYRGPLPTEDEMPAGMRAQVERWRDRRGRPLHPAALSRGASSGHAHRRALTAGNR